MHLRPSWAIFRIYIYVGTSLVGFIADLFKRSVFCRWLSAALFTGGLGSLCYFGRWMIQPICLSTLFCSWGSSLKITPCLWLYIKYGLSSVDVVGKLRCSVKGILKHVQDFRNNMVVDKRSLLTEGILDICIFGLLKNSNRTCIWADVDDWPYVCSDIR